jgi:hypothetical protein
MCLDTFLVNLILDQPKVTTTLQEPAVELERNL